MLIDVYSTVSSFQEEDIRNKTIVVIDVLRASSTIVTALVNGAKEIIPVEDMAEAGKIAQNLDSSRYLLCGEKESEKVDGYHLGNSPLEYTNDVVGGKTLIFSTTNGTKVITRAVHAKKVIIGCFLNVGSVINELKQTNSEIVLACAGWKNRLSLEDILCAGMIISEITNGKIDLNARDGAKIAFVLYDKYKNQIKDLLLASNHAQRLNSLGYTDDIEYCAMINTTPLLPVLKEGIITGKNAG